MRAEVSLLPYSGNFEHLEDELDWTDCLIRLSIRTQYLRNQAVPEEQTARSVYVSESEVEWLLSSNAQHRDDDPSIVAERNEVARIRAEIDRRVARSEELGVFLAMPKLCEMFGLSVFERDTLVICVAPELRRKYDRLYAYAQDDITRKRPSVALVLELLCESEAARWSARSSLSDGATLVRAGLIEKMPDPHSPSGSSGLAEFLRLDPRIRDYILANNSIDPRLAGDAQLLRPSGEADLPIDPAVVRGLSHLVEHNLAQGNPNGRKLVVHLHGPVGIGRKTLALHLSGALGCCVLRVDAELLLARGTQGETLLRLAFREAMLQQAALYIEHADVLLQESARVLLSGLRVAIAEYGWLVFLSAANPWTAHFEFPGCDFYSTALAMPEVPARAAVWERALGDEAPKTADWAMQLAAQFRQTPGEIRATVEFARTRMRLEAEPQPMTVRDLAAACRHQSNHKLNDLAVKIEPKYGWEDLVLPADKIAHLREICSHVRNQFKVFEKWGFGKRMSHGRGLSALFSGPSGTGKTMAAEVLAHDLALDLYKVDLARLVSKYIGETEKNFARVFSEATTSNAILFFDEADALFGKRTEVSDAHDRYANLETSYLLQKIEEYEGVVIMTTNLRENLDEAFTRRIRFIVEFPFPDEALCLRIWKGHLAPPTPVSSEVDYACLARELRLPGGNIRNVVLNAAFLAAENGGTVNMEHISHGSRREYEKMGKIWRQASLGRTTPH